MRSDSSPQAGIRGRGPQPMRHRSRGKTLGGVIYQRQQVGYLEWFGDDLRRRLRQQSSSLPQQELLIAGHQQVGMSLFEQRVRDDRSEEVDTVQSRYQHVEQDNQALLALAYDAQGGHAVARLQHLVVGIFQDEPYGVTEALVIVYDQHLRHVWLLP